MEYIKFICICTQSAIGKSTSQEWPEVWSRQPSSNMPAMQRKSAQEPARPPSTYTSLLRLPANLHTNLSTSDVRYVCSSKRLRILEKIRNAKREQKLP